MRMKAIGGCLIVLFLATMPAFAQGQPPGADDIVSKMQSKLNLTQDQVTAVTPIIEKYLSKRRELREAWKTNPADKDSTRSQMKQLKEDENQELSQFLSSEQMSQWEQMQSQGRRHNHSSDAEGVGN